MKECFARCEDRTCDLPHTRASYRARQIYYGATKSTSKDSDSDFYGSDSQKEYQEADRENLSHDMTKQSDCAPSKDSDQPGHLPSLIRVFAVRMKEVWVLSYQLSAQRRLIRLDGCPG